MIDSFVGGYREWKAIKIHPDADPDFNSNWRIVPREELEASESSYYESDGENLNDDSEVKKEKGDDEI